MDELLVLLDEDAGSPSLVVRGATVRAPSEEDSDCC